MNFKIFFVLLITINSMRCLTPARVILATDNNPTYIQFWPIVAKAWQQWIDLKPTLALVAEEGVRVDESLGDVIHFKPIPGIPTSFYAQVVRLLLPILYPDEVCILSDIDMLPISRIFFTRCAEHIPDDHFVVYTNKAYEGLKAVQYPICYNAAKGSVFRALVGITSLSEIPRMVCDWYNFKIGWTSDEKILYGLLRLWEGYPDKLSLLGYKTGNQRIDRGNWGYDKALLESGYYIDSHLFRPYHQYKHTIDTLIQSVITIQPFNKECRS